MRALSVRQPWAELIASGKKKIEYRTWTFDHRGDLLIVASASRHDDDCADEGLDPTSLAYGAAVCVVELWKVTGNDGGYSWHVRNPRRVEPFRVKGSASIYTVDDKLIRFAKPTRERATGSRKPKQRAPRPRLVDGPGVLVATPDPGKAASWQRALRALGCRATRVRDGYAAWLHLDAQPTACLLIDTDVEGFSAKDVVARMREHPALAETPVIVVGSGPVAKDENLSQLRRAPSADAVARAVQAALSAG